MTRALKSALSAIDTTCTDPLVRAKLRGLMRGYDARWANQEYRTLAVEHLEIGRVVNPDTSRDSRTFRSAGKIDVIATDARGAVGIVDHKTSSEDIGDPDSPYWRQLVVENQPSHYHILLWSAGMHRTSWATWDVVRKPGISPRQITKDELTSINATGTYCGVTLSPADIAEAAATKRESVNLYEARVALDCTTIRPHWYFQRRQVPRLDIDLLDYARFMWDISQEVIQARYNERHPRSPKACMQYHGPCKFLGICSGHDNPESDNWRRKEQVHSELPIVDGDGRDLLTNSRIGTFLLCRYKHYLEYELGIERVEEEDRAALIFGNLWHAAQEAWWAEFKEASNGDTPTGDSATAVECAPVGGEA